MSITSVLKIDRGYPQRVYTFLFHFSSFAPFSLFTTTSFFAPYLSSRATSDRSYIDRFFFLPPFAVSATIPSCVCRNSVTYPTEIDTLRSEDIELFCEL